MASVACILQGYVRRHRGRMADDRSGDRAVSDLEILLRDRRHGADAAFRVLFRSRLLLRSPGICGAPACQPDPSRYALRGTLGLHGGRNNAVAPHCQSNKLTKSAGESRR